MTMQLVPAIDLKEGACVQLVGGVLAHEKIRLPDPVAEARKWADQGAEWLHVVDLDRAFQRGNNFEIVTRIIEAVSDRVKVQVGGGLRFTQDIDAVLDAGAARIVVGTRAVQDEAFLKEVAERYGKRAIVAVDARDGEVVIRGWTESSGKPLGRFAREAARHGVGGLLYTDVGREGRLGGANVLGVRSLVEAVPGTPIIASGGVSAVDDLLRLQMAGASATIVGMALYSGKIDYRKATDALRVSDEAERKVRSG